MTKQYNNKLDINLNNHQRETLACLGISTAKSMTDDKNNKKLASDMQTDNDDSASSAQLIDSLKESIGTLHQLLYQLENFDDLQVNHQLVKNNKMTIGLCKGKGTGKILPKMSLSHCSSFKPDMTYQNIYQQKNYLQGDYSLV